MPHTPGPWQHGVPSFKVSDRFVKQVNGQVIAYCDGPLDIAKANAAFIAAAPELLEALKAVPCQAPAFIRTTGGCDNQCVRCAAIAKAES